jgi:competence protein ComEC
VAGDGDQGRWRRAPAPARLAPHAVVGALAAGLTAALVRPPAQAVVVPAAALGVLAAALLLRGGAAAALTALVGTAALAGLAWGTARLEATDPPRLALPAAAAGGVIVEEAAEVGGRQRSVRAVAASLAAGGRLVPEGTRVLLLLPRDGPAAPPGTRLRVTGRLVPAAERRSPGWWRRYLERQGVAARLAARSARADGRRGGVAGLRDRWREWVTSHAAAGLTGDRGAVVRGMALGGGSRLSEPAARAFRDSGLWHLLAVSGQNVAVVALAVLAGLRGLGVRRRPAVAASGAMIAAYCLACDGGASVARAGVVGGLGVLAELRSSARERWYLLLVALAALLAAQPRSIADPGLQLSFAAVVGILAVAPPLAAWLAGWLPRRVADLAALAAGAGLATAPVLAAHFGRLSLVGLVANVVAVPLAGPVVVLALAAIPAGAVLPAAGIALSWPAGLGGEALLALARTAAAVPGSTVEVPAWTTLPLAALPLAPPLVARWLARPPRESRRRRPRAPRPAAVLALGVAAVLAVGHLAVRDRPPPWPDTPAVTALDVGQGDAILLRSPDGAAVLVDTGPSYRAPVLSALRRAGVRRLALVAVTHDQDDHAGGLAAVLDRHDVGLLVHPPLAPDSADLRRTLAAARTRGVEVREVAEGARISAGQWLLRVVGPRGPPPPGADPNGHSLVVLATAGSLDALLTADAESPALQGVDLPPVDVLKVAHHGSADPGLRDLLERIRPRVALVSVGSANRYGHPAPETLAALRAGGTRVWRTDRDGDVTVSGAAGTLAVQTEG